MSSFEKISPSAYATLRDLSNQIRRAADRADGTAPAFQSARALTATARPTLRPTSVGQPNISSHSPTASQQMPSNGTGISKIPCSARPGRVLTIDAVTDGRLLF